MSGAWGVISLWAATIAVGTIAYAFRDFSRSRLEDICEKAGNRDRFSAILRSQDHAILLADSLQLVVLSSLFLAATAGPVRDYFEFPNAAGGSAWFIWVARTLGLIILTWMSLIVLPWTISRVRGEQLLYRLWPAIAFLKAVSRPLWRFSSQIDRTVHRMAGLPEPDSTEANSLLTEEILAVVEEAERESILKSDASDMIHRVVDLHKEDAASIMTPRTDMITIPGDWTLEQAVPFVVSEGFSRVPVIGSDTDDIRGILYTRDLLPEVAHQEGDARTVSSLARDVLFIPESQPIHDLLRSMQQQKVHMAIVVDEYSGVSGLVTLEDILEEIVGEIADEYDDDDQPLITRESESAMFVDARCPIDDLNEKFDLSLPEDAEYDTVGGYLLSHFGRIPSQGEAVHRDDCRLEVLEADQRRLIRLRLEFPTEARRRQAQTAMDES